MSEFSIGSRYPAPLLIVSLVLVASVGDWACSSDRQFAEGNGGSSENVAGAPAEAGSSAKGGGQSELGGEPSTAGNGGSSNGGNEATAGEASGGSLQGDAGASGNLEDGEQCTTDDECLNGHCVDGYCCESACTGQCESCSAMPGQCVAVTTPRTPCRGSGACAGECNGTDGASCVYPGEEKTCAQASCSGSTAKAAATCDGDGACSMQDTTTCKYGCQPGTAVCSTCRQKSSANILTNPGLDGSLEGWELGGDGQGRYSANDADSCANSGSFSFASIGDNASSACKGASPNKTYYLAYKFKSLAATPGASGDCSILFYDSASCGNELGRSSEVISPASDANSWVAASDSAKSPAGTAGIRVFCAGFAGHGYYDQFYLGLTAGTF